MKNIKKIFILLSFSFYIFSLSEEEILKEIENATVYENNVEEIEEEVTTTSTSEYQSGKASWYGSKWNGKKTASGELFNSSKLTAAHKKLKFGTKVKVTNQANGKSVIVRINDRGPHTKNRIIDLSQAAFQSIGNTSSGVINVKLELVN